MAAGVASLAERAGSDRVVFVDALRGFALLGLFVVHMCELYELWWANPYPNLTHDAVFLLFSGKSYAVLALCFGFSFQAMGDSALRRGDNFARFFAWRVFLLLLIGWLHGLLYRGDIVVVLAAEGFLLIPFFTVRSNRLLLAITALCFAGPLLLVRIWAGSQGAEWANAAPLFNSDPSMQAYLHGTFAENLQANLWAAQVQKWSFFIEYGRVFHIFGLFLIGLMLGRSRWFAREHPARIHAGLVGLFAALSVTFYQLAGTAGAEWGGEGYRQYIPMLFSGWSALAITGLSVTAFHALWQLGGRGLIAWLAEPGRMTLTLYIGQSVVFVPFFYGFGWGAWEWLSQEAALVIGLVAFAIQAAFAHWWFARYHYGPLEWLWRAGTRRTTAVPFRKR